MAFHHLTSAFLLLLTFTGQSWSTPLLPQTSSANSPFHYVLKNGTTIFSQKSAVYCTFDSDCHTVAGFYSECYNSRCICDLGYRSMNGLSTCQKQACTNNSDCTRYFYGTRCELNNTCVCDYGFYKNVSSQTCLYSNASKPVNNRPILGVLLQEHDHKTHQYVAASYVKFLESGGARVVPIFINRTRSYYESLVNQINGILMPGGSTPLLKTLYSTTADLLLDLAIAKNKAGSYFPVWGTCLSFQKMATYFTGNQLSWAVRCDVDNVALPLEIAQNINPTTTKMFGNIDGGEKIIETLRHFNTTPNYHISCLSTEYFEKTKNLTEQFTVISTNTWNGVHFVSTFEHKHLPIYGSAWHPEKNQFEWVVNAGVGSINHDAHAIAVGQYFGNFLVNEARKNTQKFRNQSEEAEALIYNYQKYSVYEGREKDASFNEIYLFPINMH